MIIAPICFEFGESSIKIFLINQIIHINFSWFYWKFTYLRHETSKWWTGQDLFCIFRYMCNYMIIIFTFMYEPTERLDKLNDHLTKAIQISFFIHIIKIPKRFALLFFIFCDEKWFSVNRCLNCHKYSLCLLDDQ